MKTLTASAIVLYCASLLGCGPRVPDEGSEDDEMPAQDLGSACADGTCPEEIVCGERVCLGAFGKLAECVDGRCAPQFSACLGEANDVATCAESCEAQGQECVAQGCDGATAVQYPGPPEYSESWFGYCGSSDPELQEVITRHDFSCDEPLPWSPDVSLIQCCCDDPES